MPGRLRPGSGRRGRGNKGSAPPPGPAPDVVPIDLDARGRLLDPRTGEPVPVDRVPAVLGRTVPVAPHVTDIVLFAHGWNTRRGRATKNAGALIVHAERLLAARPRAYPALPAEPRSRLYLVLRWPSASSPLRRGYRRIRDRAHALSTEGNAAHVLAALLGYLNHPTDGRILPRGATARSSGGQYLTCVGHSFGGRVLCQAIQESSRAGTAGPVRADPRYPYTVDNLLVFQMAALPGSFAPEGVFRTLLTAAPVSGPVTLTTSHADRATGVWHWLAERTGGIGTVGVRGAVVEPARTVLHGTEAPYEGKELGHVLVEVDAGWRFRGRWWTPAGGHSDIRHPESAHLLLSLMDFSR
ncbi:hypothetical protein [Streptomyces sp. NPDC050504]|uniref:hypothetical protein n=1 Tax=Streptomyces sp. NPDC050504 TaxID=3365618 RepID=UPI0037879020